MNIKKIKLNSTTYDVHDARINTIGNGLSNTSGTLDVSASGVTAGSYGPTENVTGDDGNTIKVPEITVNSYGQVTSVTERVYTSKNTTYNLGDAAYKGVATSIGDTGSNAYLATEKAVRDAINALPEPMIFKGSLGTTGTITSLPTASSSNKGFTYKVIEDGEYASQSAKVGDTFISDGSSWILIPSGDEPSGTVTSIATGNGLTGGPITSSGTISLSAATESALGGVKVGSGLSVTNDGTLSANSQTDNNFTTVYKNKLDSIATGAEVNVQADWNETNTSSDAYIQNKPSALSEFPNDVGYITSSGSCSYATSSGSSNYANSAGSATYASSFLASRQTIGASSQSHAQALQSYFDDYASSIPRDCLTVNLSHAYGNDSLYLGYFIYGYDSAPYGGFYVCHYDTPYYVGISNGSYNQQQIITSSSIGSQSVNYATSASVASKVQTSIGDVGSAEIVRGDMNSDQFRILIASDASNQGWAEIATADDGTEPIYVRQYTGVFTNLARTATLLDGNGNTSFPGTITSGGFVKDGSSNDYVLLGGGSHAAVSSLSVNYANSASNAGYLHVPSSNGNGLLEALQNFFESCPKSEAVAVRLQHGSHSMAYGWFLEGYSYNNAYGGWFVSYYGTPIWVGVDNGTWRTAQFIMSDTIGSQSVAYATSAGSAPASDVYSWAKASSKPSYSWSEITDKPSVITSDNIGQQDVNYATYAGTATYANAAGSVAWGDVLNKPTIPVCTNVEMVGRAKIKSNTYTLGATTNIWFIIHIQNPHVLDYDSHYDISIAAFLVRHNDTQKYQSCVSGRYVCHFNPWYGSNITNATKYTIKENTNQATDVKIGYYTWSGSDGGSVGNEYGSPGVYIPFCIKNTSSTMYDVVVEATVSGIDANVTVARYSGEISDYLWNEDEDVPAYYNYD